MHSPRFSVPLEAEEPQPRSGFALRAGREMIAAMSEGSPETVPTDPDVLERVIALGESLAGHPDQVGSVVPQLLAILDRESDPTIVAACVEALSSAWDDTAVAGILDRVPVDHPDDDVRLALAQALHCGPERPDTVARAAHALVLLSADESDDVRDWACFGLGLIAGQPGVDTGAVRQAMLARVDDPYPDARHEAVAALATLGDPRAEEVLLGWLTGDPAEIQLVDMESAATLASPKLLGPLLALAEDWERDADAFSDALDLAVRRCAPRSATRAAEHEAALVAALSERLRDGRVARAQAYPWTVLIYQRDSGGAPVRERIWLPTDDPAHFDLDAHVSAWLAFLEPEPRE